MFTGIIQTQARITNIEKSASEARFSFAPLKMFDNLQIGESIAINGVCLTVEKFNSANFSVYASSKTLEMTNLSFLNLQSLVNCERALALGDRLGGHIVTGHVDALTPLLSIDEKLSSKICTFEIPQSLQGLIISQGSVCLDGISLTITEITDSSFSVNLIPETWKETTAALWKIGSLINIESDIIGKYVQSKVPPYESQNIPKSNITETFLRERGF